MREIQTDQQETQLLNIRHRMSAPVQAVFTLATVIAVIALVTLCSTSTQAFGLVVVENLGRPGDVADCRWTRTERAIWCRFSGINSTKIRVKTIERVRFANRQPEPGRA